MAKVGTFYSLLCNNLGGKYVFTTCPTKRVVYISTFWAHRTVNVSNKSLIFLAIFPAHAGHDYKTIEKTGFLKRIFLKEGKIILIDPKISPK